MVVLQPRFAVYFSASTESMLLYILNSQCFAGQNLKIVEYIFRYFPSGTKMLSVVMGKSVLIAQVILLSCNFKFLGLTGEGQKNSETNPLNYNLIIISLFLFLTH